jgi:predicted metalloprotease
MRTPLVIVVSAALIAGLLPGPAAGETARTTRAGSYAPVLPRVLTGNRLYRTGPLPRRGCSVPAVRKNDPKSAARHLRAWLGCLDKAWLPLLKAARLPYATPKVRFITDPGTEACGTDWQEVGLALYCDKTIAINLEDSLLKTPDRLFLLEIAAYEYGNHIQALSGIGKAADHLTGEGESEQESEYLRRYNLQANCLAGAFMGSVWKSLHRPARDLREFLDVMRRTGDDARRVEERWHGMGRSVVYWVKRGFAKPSAAQCNTWTAPGKLVA